MPIVEVGGEQITIGPARPAIRVLDDNGNPLFVLDSAGYITTVAGINGGVTITGPIRVAGGTAALPAYSFTDDPDSGVYRIGANNVGVSVNGAGVVDIGTGGVGVTGTLTATTINASGAGGNRSILGNTDADAGNTGAVYQTFQTANGTSRWAVGQSAGGGTGNFEFYGYAQGAVALSIAKTTGLIGLASLDGLAPSGAGLVIGADASSKLGFYGHATVAQQAGVAVTDAAIHAALVALGLITA